MSEQNLNLFPLPSPPAEVHDRQPPITLKSLRKLVAKGESEILEFKSTTGTLKEATQTVCAMLNREGGKVLIGVSDGGEIKGQQLGNETIENVSTEIRKIEPAAFPNIDMLPVENGRHVIVISVGPGQDKPYQYKGTPYHRMGSSTVPMSPHEYRRIVLEQMHAHQRWENQVAQGWTVDNLDWEEIQRMTEAAARKKRLSWTDTGQPMELLRKLDLLDSRGSLLNAAAALFGKNEHILGKLPQCLLCTARFQGIDRTDILDNRQFRGNVFSLLEHAEQFIHDKLPIAGWIEPGSMARIDKPLYPHVATREALINALCHRDYRSPSGSVVLAVFDDRLEVTSTGGLHFGLDPKKLLKGARSQPWNPLIADVFHRCGLIERLGSGIERMTKAMAAENLPRPDIEDDGDSVTVRFRRGRAKARQRDRNGALRRQEAILALLERHVDGLTLDELCTKLASDASERQVRRALVALKERRLVLSTRGRSARWSKVPDSIEKVPPGNP